MCAARVSAIFRCFSPNLAVEPMCGVLMRSSSSAPRPQSYPENRVHLRIPSLERTCSGSNLLFELRAGHGRHQSSTSFRELPLRPRAKFRQHRAKPGQTRPVLADSGLNLVDIGPGTVDFGRIRSNTDQHCIRFDRSWPGIKNRSGPNPAEDVQDPPGDGQS